MRAFVAILSVFGVLLFGSAFVASYVNPPYVESIGREVVRIEVERRVNEKLETLDDSRLGKLAARLSGRNAAEIDVIRQQLVAGVPAKIAAVVAQMRDPNCPCRTFIESAITEGFRDRLSLLARMNTRLTHLIRTRYMEAVASLMREFRIFTGANALVFALLGLTVMLRKRATYQLALPAIILVGAAAIVGYLYLFQQDWLHTIVFNDYVGLGYFAWLGVAVACLADIVLNRGRITTMIVNGVLSAAGAAVSAVPC